MRSKPIINHRRIIHVVVSITAVVAMSIMAFLVKPVLADEEFVAVCDSETVVAPEGSSAAYTYKLDTDCTLHVGPVDLPEIDKTGINDDSAYPIKQHSKVKHIIFDDPVHTRLNEDSNFLFDGYPNVESIERINELDTSHVKKFGYMFAGLRHLKEPVDLSNFDMKSADSMNSMFQDSNLDMFKGFSNFVFDFDQKQFSKLSFASMFKNATSTEGIDLSNWQFLNSKNGFMVTDSMFEGIKTPKIDVNSLAGITIDNATNMFANTNTEIDGIEHFGMITWAGSMFENAKPVNHIDLSSWDTKWMTHSSNMFRNSDIDKFSGMDSWKLPGLEQAGGMYAGLNPSHPVRIQPSMPSLSLSTNLFSGSNIDMFPDIANLQLASKAYPLYANTMFENAKGTYLNISGWKNGIGFKATGMLASPYIRFMTFGNKTVGNTWFSDFDVESGEQVFKDSNGVNIWDRSDLPPEYSSKKWATLPIKQECEAKFDGNPDRISDGCRDDYQSWMSSRTGAAADDELFDSGHYHRIFFRVASIPVTFNANGVEDVHDMPPSMNFDRRYTKNDDMLPPELPEDPSGAKEFISYNTQADGKGKTYYPGDHFGHDIDSLTLYAQWKTINRTVRFIDPSNEAENLPNEATVAHGSEYTIPSQVPTRLGYTFEGWSVEKDGQVEYQPDDVIKIASNMDLYAQWKVNKYSIRFIDPSKEAENLPDKATVSYKDGYKYTITDQTPTRTGYSFVGWSTEENGEAKYQPGDVLKVTADMNLYAQWKANDYSIKFIDPSKEGKNLPDEATISYGSEYKIPNQIPTRTGYDFVGWSTEKDGEAKYRSGDVLKVTSDTNLYAQWKVNNYSIRFVDPSNEGKNLPDEASIPYGSKYTIPSQAPTRKGYDFKGWATGENGKVKYQPGDVLTVNGNISLYAVWSKKAPAVKFNNNGGEGTVPATKPTDDNTKIAVDCTNRPSRDGATFIGWSKTKNDVLEGPDAGEKGKIDVCGYSGKKTIAGLQGRTIDLYATWARNPKAVFNENRPDGMTALLPEIKTITGDWHVDDSTPRTYVAPNIEGWNKGYTPDGVYRFDGWMNENGTPFTGAYLDREDMTINAKWSRIASAENHNHDNDNNDQNNHDNGNTDDNNGDTVDDNANNNHEDNDTDNNSNSDSDTTNNQQNSINRPGTTPIISSIGNQEADSSPLLDSSPEGSLDASVEPAAGNESESAADDTGSPSSQHADTSEGNNLAKTGASIIAPIVLIIASIVGATAAIVFSRTRSRKQQ